MLGLLLLLLFVVGVVVAAVRIFGDNVSVGVMPWSCPHCAYGGKQDLEGYIRWWSDVERGRLQCRECGTIYKEHPNGTLVEDRDI